MADDPKMPPGAEDESADVTIELQEGASEETEKAEKPEPVVPNHLEDEHRLSFLLQHDKRFLYMAVLVLVLAVAVLGYLIRSQEINLASINQSIVNLSQTVRDLASNRQAEVKATGEKVIREANVASIYCLENGGQLALAKRPDGAEYGLCLFGPDRQCEEWAFQRGECPMGGVDISQFSNPADVYCVVTGNQIAPSLIPGRSGKCAIDGRECDSQAYYETGDCQE
jgi:putative hemolysin